jgi:Ser/Thr protein kinase RdoA (MazF antagonist)
MKLYRGSAGWKATKERRIIEALSGNTTLRTAPLLGAGHLDGYDLSVLITADLGDLTLWQRVEENACSFPEAMRLVGQLLATFHDSDLAIGSVGDEAHDRFGITLEQRVQQQRCMLDRVSPDELAPRVEPALRRLVRLSQQTAPDVACHGDLHPANIVMSWSENGVLLPYLVDFEETVRCPPEYDLAKSVVTSSALGDDERRTLLAGYGDRCVVSDELFYALVVFHTLDGWLYGALQEKRDQSLWGSRIDEMLARYAPIFE